MDDETKHWPMPLRYKDDFDKIKFGYCAVPLAVYIGKKFVEPAKVNDAISAPFRHPKEREVSFS
jgi:hypothetical protein